MNAYDPKCLSIPWIGFPVRPAPELYATQLMVFVNPVPMADNLTTSTSSHHPNSSHHRTARKRSGNMASLCSTARVPIAMPTRNIPEALFTGGFIFQTHGSSASNGAHFRGAPLYKTNSSKLQEFSILLLTVVAV